MTGLKGHLLVAAPGLVDANFFRTVVLLAEHTEEGAAGVILNRPTDTELAGPLAEWRSLAADPPLVFFGGPVSPSAAVCLGRVEPGAEAPAWEPVVDGLGVVDLGRDTEEAQAGLDRVRVFAGYAGWEAGQLERELEEDSWYVLDADPEDALCSEPGGLWRTVLKRQGGRLALVANFPADPSAN